MSRWEVVKIVLLSLLISAGLIGIPILAWAFALTQ